MDDEERYPWVPDYLPSDGKRVGWWICPFCDGLVLAPQSPLLHVKADHPDEFAKLLAALSEGKERDGGT